MRVSRAAVCTVAAARRFFQAMKKLTAYHWLVLFGLALIVGLQIAQVCGVHRIAESVNVIVRPLERK